MSYQVIENFKNGLDARKLELGAPAGTLVELKNGHITNGGEIEKRKAFPLFADLDIDDSNNDPGVFGFQRTKSGFTVFGHAALFGASPTLSQPTLASAIPVTVPVITYQQLQHPAIVEGTTFDRAKHRITAVRASNLFGGLIMVAATFSDGYVFGYYDGALVLDLLSGRILPHLSTNAKIASHLVRMFNASGRFTAAIVAGGGNEHKLNVEGPKDTAYDIQVTLDTTLGTLSNSKLSDPVSSTTGVIAQGGFNVVAGSEYSKVTTTRERTSNVAKLGLAAGHGLVAGFKVTIAGFTGGNTGYNAAGVLITATTSTSISYANTGANEGTTADVLGRVKANYVATVKVNGVDVMPVPIPFTTDITATAALIAAAINGYTSAPDYTADSTGGRVTIKAAAVGTSSNAFDIAVTTEGNVCCEDLRFTFQGTGFIVTGVNPNGTNILGTASYHMSPANITSISALVQALADDINARTFTGSGTGTHGYVAYAFNNQLYLSRAATASSLTEFSAWVTFTEDTGATGGVIGDNPISGGTYQVAASPAAFVMTLKNFNLGSGNPTGDCVVYTPGVPQNYSYAWRRKSFTDLTAVFGSADPFHVQPSLSKERVTKFSASSGFFPVNRTGTAQYVFVCDVTGPDGVIVTTNDVLVTVNYQFTN